MMTMTDGVRLAIPSGDLYYKRIGRILSATLSYNNKGNGSITHINNVYEPSNDLKSSLLIAKHAAGKFIGKHLVRIPSFILQSHTKP